MRKPVPRQPLVRVAAAVLLCVALAGCSGDDSSSPEVGADELLASGSEAMAEVETVRLRLSTEADLAELPVREADAQVTADGDAAGTARMELMGQLVEVELVAVGDSFHYRLLGSWQELSRAEGADLYDPSTILDPERGVANLLRTATDAELVAGPDGAGGSYRVAATFDPDAVAALLPGAPETVTGDVWIEPDSRRLRQIVFDLPAGPATVELSEYDAPAEISAP